MLHSLVCGFDDSDLSADDTQPEVPPAFFVDHGVVAMRVRDRRPVLVGTVNGTFRLRLAASTDARTRGSPTNPWMLRPKCVPIRRLRGSLWRGTMTWSARRDEHQPSSLRVDLN